MTSHLSGYDAPHQQQGWPTQAESSGYPAASNGRPGETSVTHANGQWTDYSSTVPGPSRQPYDAYPTHPGYSGPGSVTATPVIPQATIPYAPPYPSVSTSLTSGQPGQWTTYAPPTARAPMAPQARAPGPPTSMPSSGGSRLHADGSTGKKKTRQQFSACRQCRSRRVRCDLKDKQEQWDLLYGDEAGGKQPTAPILSGVQNRPRDKLACTNCTERKQICIDIFADIKAARQFKKATQKFPPYPRDQQPGASANHRPPQGASHPSGPSQPQLYGYPGNAHSSSTSSASPSDADGQPGTAGPYPAPGLPTPLMGGQAFGNQQQGVHGNGQQRPMPSQPSVTVSMAAAPETLRYPTGGPNALPAHFASSMLDSYAISPKTIIEPTISARSSISSGAMKQDGMPTGSADARGLGKRPSETTLAGTAVFQDRYHASDGDAASSERSPAGPIVLSPADNNGLAEDVETLYSLPELTVSFFKSSFFRRFHVQRPILEPEEFTRRYLSIQPPAASNMGAHGAILCHVLYAWACSYGVNEAGEQDSDDGTMDPFIPHINAETPQRQDRQAQRDRRKAKTNAVVRFILNEIDEASVMRRQSWDGVRSLLLVLPLTEHVQSPMDRLAMYNGAVAQVFSMCSLSAVSYDGRMSSAETNGDSEMIKIRLYWYSFVHEGITTGLKGGRLVLDEEDLQAFHATLPHGWSVVHTSRRYQSAARLATAPIRLAMACRLIHKALTGPKARRREAVSKEAMMEAWEALEQCWLEFDAIAQTEPPPHLQQEDIVRFSDGWKIFMFEAHNICRELLSHRLLQHNVDLPKPQAFLTDLSIGSSPKDGSDESIANRRIVQQLHEIARIKCNDHTAEILKIVRKHVGSTFFRYDASLVRDGTYYAAMLLAAEDGTEEDIAVCLQALSEMRWGFAKTAERSAKLRDTWNARHGAVHKVYAYDTPALTTGSSTLFSSNPASSTSDSGALSLPPAQAIISDLSQTTVFTEATGMYVPLADTASLSASGMDILGLQAPGELFGYGAGEYEYVDGLEGYGYDVVGKGGEGEAFAGGMAAQAFDAGDAGGLPAYYGGEAGYYAQQGMMNGGGRGY